MAGTPAPGQVAGQNGACLLRAGGAMLLVMVMPDPICTTVLGRPIHWYGVFMALGFAAGLFHLILLGRREGRDSAFASDLVFWILIGGLVGARLAYVLANPREFLADPIQLIRVDQGGLVFYGGFFGAAFTIWRFARAHRIPLWRLYDFTLTALPLGHAFGRLGCTLNGCCHGFVFEGPFALVYPARSTAWWYQVEYLHSLPSTAPLAHPLFPVQPLEALANLLIYLILNAAYRKPHRDGAVTALYFALYPSARFVLEFLRGDKAERLVWMGLSSAQWISLILLIASAIAFHRLSRGTHDRGTDRPA